MVETSPGKAKRASQKSAASCTDRMRLPLFADSCNAPLAPDIAAGVIADSCNARSPTPANDAESSKWFPAMAKSLWKPKPAQAVHDLVGGDDFAKLRTVYAWIAGISEPKAGLLVRLLCSRDGRRVLQYLMRQCSEPWWRDLQRAERCAGAYERERQLARD